MYSGRKVWYNAGMDENAFFKAARAGLPGGAYLLCGDEPYSRAAAVRLVCDSLGDAARDMNLSAFTAPAAADVINACESLPFFDERRVVTVREADKDALSALAAYAENVPPTTVLLILHDGKPRADSPLYKALSKAGEGEGGRVIEFTRADPARAQAFLEKRAKENGFALERAAARQLVQWVGVDLAGLETALLRVSGYVGAGNPVTLSAVEACVPPSTEYAIFAMLDSLIAGNRKAALSQLSGMLSDGTDDPNRLASFFEGRFRLMLLAKRMLQNGAAEAEIVREIGGSPFAAKRTVANAKKCTLPQLSAAVTAFADVLGAQRRGEADSEYALLAAVFGFLTFGGADAGAQA